jgi:hypothetical protein
MLPVRWFGTTNIIFQPKAEMKEQYMRDRYNAKLMLRSVSSFYR